MKINNIGLFILLAASLIAGSCSKVLDKKNLNSYSDSQIFGNFDLARAYINRIYDDNEPAWPSKWMNVSDEEGGSSKYFDGTIDLTDTQDDFGTSINTGNFWGKLRAINQAILSLKSSTIDEDDRKHPIWHFWRADLL